MWKTFYCFIYLISAKMTYLQSTEATWKFLDHAFVFWYLINIQRKKIFNYQYQSVTHVHVVHLLKSPVNGSSNSILQHRVGFKICIKICLIWIILWSTTKLIYVYQFGSWSDYYSNYISVAFNGTIYKNIFFTKVQSRSVLHFSRK